MDRLSFSDIIDENTEFIPLMTSDEEVEIGDDQLPELLPILPLRNTVRRSAILARGWSSRGRLGWGPGRRRRSRPSRTVSS